MKHGGMVMVAASVTMFALDVAGVAMVPWWVVVVPVAVPALWWVLRSLLALVVIGGGRVAGRVRR